MSRIPSRIESYALLGDTQTAALVSNGGSLDWLCLPDFDSAATFAALLGDQNNGRWLIAPRKGVRSIAGPDSVWLHTPVETRDQDAALRADFSVAAGELIPFVLAWRPSHEPAPEAINPIRALADTEAFWADWLSSCTYQGNWREPIVRSLLTLKALAYAPTGGIVAAPTTSLREKLGGVRNWDYRYAWLRDAAVTLLAVTRAGFHAEAKDWHSWLLRAIAGDPADLQAVYGVAGERHLSELELPWLAGYESSKPMRIGSDAATQFQLDLYGEVVNTTHHARRAGLEDNRELWALTRALVAFVESHWQLPDEGLWEVRAPAVTSSTRR